MPKYEIEMLWKCHVCQHEGNRGMARHCAGCGKPKSESDSEYFPDDISENNAIQGPADSAADWKCKYCGALQSDSHACCDECGCNKDSGKREWDSEVISASENFDGTDHHETRRRVHVGDAVPAEVITSAQEEWKDRLHTEQAAWRNEAAKQEPKSSLLTGKGAIALGLACLAVAVALFFLFRTRELNSGVRSVSWRHTVLVDRRHLVPEEGWSPSFDAVGVQDLGLRLFGYDHRIVGSHQESYSDTRACGQTCTPRPCYRTARSCTSSKNGRASCSGGDQVCPSPSCSTRYCPYTAYRTVNDYQDFPILRPYYAWREWHWDQNRRIERTGVNTDTNWPSDDEVALNVNMSGGESERSSTDESYEVQLGHHGEIWKFVPKTDSEFRLYPVGSRHEVKVNALGQVEILRHGR